MIEEYVSTDRRHDDLYERFMEQRLQKLNNPEQPGMDDSLLFPIEPTVPTASTHKRISNASNVSGVNFPRVL